MPEISGSRVTVTTSPTVIVAADGQSILIKNIGSIDVDLGGATVAAGAGFPLAAGGEVAMDLQGWSGGLYAVTASATAVVCVLRIVAQ